MYKPTNEVRMELEERYGYTLEWPPPGLNKIVQTAFSKKEDSLLVKRDSLKLIPCKGYIDPKTGKLFDPTNNSNEPFSSNYISGYVIALDLPTTIPIIQNYLLNEAEPWFKYQVERAKFTSQKIRQAGIKTGQTTIENARLKQENYLSINKKLTTGLEDINWNELM